MSIRRLLAGAALGVIASALAPVAAGAQPIYPPQTGGLTVSATSVVAGSAVSVSGTGFAPASSVTVTVVVQDFGVVRSFTTKADSAGNVATSVLLSVAGTATVTMSGADPDGVPRLLTSTVFVASPPSAAGPPGQAGPPSKAGLPNTGANVLSPLVIGGVLVLGGAGAIVAARRRRR